jgi:hypothetical protein
MPRTYSLIFAVARMVSWLKRGFAFGLQAPWLFRAKMAYSETIALPFPLLPL